MKISWKNAPISYRMVRKDNEIGHKAQSWALACLKQIQASNYGAIQVTMHDHSAVNRAVIELWWTCSTKEKCKYDFQKLCNVYWHSVEMSPLSFFFFIYLVLNPWSWQTLSLLRFPSVNIYLSTNASCMDLVLPPYDCIFFLSLLSRLSLSSLSWLLFIPLRSVLHWQFCPLDLVMTTNLMSKCSPHQFRSSWNFRQMSNSLCSSWCSCTSKKRTFIFAIALLWC